MPNKVKRLSCPSQFHFIITYGPCAKTELPLKTRQLIFLKKAQAIITPHGEW
jgi:hypothetical protein